MNTRLFGLLVVLAVPCSLNAHQPGTSSVLIRVDDSNQLSGEVHVADVDFAAIELMLRNEGGVDAPKAAELPWIVIRADEQPLTLVPQPPRKANSEGRIHTMIPFTAGIITVEKIEIEYVDYFRFDPQHKVVTSLESAGATRVGMLDYGEPVWSTTVTASGPTDQFLRFTWEGMWHIWIGIDHILFLLALLLPSVLVFREGKWEPVPVFHDALVNVFKVVTAFTVAHSVTLSLAALHVVSLPSKFVESVIAVSVLLAALNNIWPLVRERTWLVAFGFGFIHGFGFANVLADLSLPVETLAIALVSFNVGVEIGQLAIVALFFPLAFAVRARTFYQPVKLRLGSALIGVIAVGWIVQRVFEVEVMPF